MPVAPPPMPMPGTYALPSGGQIYGPFMRIPFLVHFWWIPPLLLATAAGLILANGIALLSPDFFAAWIGLFPWVAPLGYFAFILGIMLGLILIGTIVLFFLGFRVLAAFIAFPTAIVSLFIGGGFILGIIIGVLAGFLVIINQRFML